MSSGPIRTLYCQRKQGFLLIEVLIALSMLCVVILGVGGYYHHLYMSQAEGKNRLQAVSIARSAMEHLCAGKQHYIKPVVEQFKVAWSITSAGTGSYAKAHVAVSWEQLAGTIRTVQLDSGVSHEYA